MRITDPGVDTQIAQLAHNDEDGLTTAIVAFFDETQASPSQNPSDIAERTRDRVKERRETPGPALRR